MDDDGGDVSHSAAKVAGPEGGRGVKTSPPPGSEAPLLDEHSHPLDDMVVAVGVGAVVGAEVHAEKSAESLPETGAERSEKRLDDRVAALVGLALDELDEGAGLIFGKLLEHGLILLEDGLFHIFEILLALLLGGEGLDILVGFEESLADELGIGESF